MPCDARGNTNLRVSECEPSGCDSTERVHEATDERTRLPPPLDIATVNTDEIEMT